MGVIARLALCIKVWGSLSRVAWQIARGVWCITRLPQPVVSVFGGGKVLRDSYYFEQVVMLVRRFIDDDISVLTGGGPGIMEAVHYGARMQPQGRGKTIGIGLKDLPGNPNPLVEEYFKVDYFFARKWLLTRYSRAFVVFPGGFGTFDELTEVLTLIATRRIGRVPVVLIGTEYWEGFMKWIEKEAIVHGLIAKEHLALITLTNDLDKVFCLVRENCGQESAVEKDEREHGPSEAEDDGEL